MGRGTVDPEGRTKRGRVTRIEYNRHRLAIEESFGGRHSGRKARKRWSDATGNTVLKEKQDPAGWSQTMRISIDNQTKMHSFSSKN